MKDFILPKKLPVIGRKKDNSKLCEKPPYAVAQRSRHIPDDDSKQRVNVAYKTVPLQFNYKHRKLRIAEFQ